MRRALILAAVAAAMGFTSGLAAGQTIYAPTQYQHRPPNNGPLFYYGGSDPFVFRMATQLSVDAGFGRVNGLAFASSTRTVRETRSQVFSDAIPGIDLAPLGYTPADAYNASQAAIPNYFRKSSLVRQAIPLGDGSRVVPATAGGDLAPEPTATPAAEARKPGVIIIMPARKPDTGFQAARPHTPPTAAKYNAPT